MCTVVILYRPEHRWPLILGANRDEMLDRPWRAPGRHWPDRPDVTAGLDKLAGGSWLGLNDTGVVAGVLNRMGTLGPAPGQRSRGELVLEALDHADAVAAAQALMTLDPESYRAFNMIVADNRDVYWLRHTSDAGARIEAVEIPPGVSMITAHDMNDTGSARVAMHLPRFEAAPPPDPDAGDWSAWEAIMASRQGGTERGREGAMAVVTDVGFGTVSASLIALPAIEAEGARPVWRFAGGLPAEVPYQDVTI